MIRVQLITLEAYNKLSPWNQGYATYLQAEQPGSTIPKTNPYKPGTHEHSRWSQGEAQGVLDVQDADDS